MLDIKSMRGFDLIKSIEIYESSYNHEYFDNTLSNYCENNNGTKIVYVKGLSEIVLDKTYKEYDNDIITNIKKLCLENNKPIYFDEMPILDKLDDNDNDDLHSYFRKIISKLYFANCDTQVEAWFNVVKIITNKKLGDFLDSNKNHLPHFLTSIFIDENQEDDTIYMFCKNQISQCGLLLVYNDDIKKYNIQKIGDYPNKSYRSFTIKLK